MEQAEVIKLMLSAIGVLVTALGVIVWTMFKGVIKRQDEHSTMLADHNTNTSVRMAEVKGQLLKVESDVRDIKERLTDIEGIVYKKAV